MVPTSSISKMFDIIRGENAISSYSTEELQEMLYISQHENLAHLSENNWHPLFHFFAGVIRPVVNPVDMNLKSATIIQYTIKGRFMSR